MRKFNYPGKQTISSVAVFFDTANLLFYTRLTAGDESVFSQVHYFGTLYENCWITFLAHREPKTSVPSLTFHCTSKVSEKVHPADRSCHLLRKEYHLKPMHRRHPFNTFPVVKRSVEKTGPKDFTHAELKQVSHWQHVSLQPLNEC